MATLRKRKVELEDSSSLELLNSINDEENLEFCETVRLVLEQNRMLPLSKLIKSTQALNDLFAYYLRSHGYNPEAHILNVQSLQHEPYRIELRHYRKADVNALLDHEKLSSEPSSLQPLLSVVKERKRDRGEASDKDPDDTEKSLFYHFISQFLEPKMKEILRKAGRKHLGLSPVQLKQLHTFFELGSIDFYSRTEIVVTASANGSIFRLDYNGMQANAIVDQCIELIGGHPELNKTLNYQVISFTVPAKRRSEELGNICGVIHEISPQPIPVISENEQVSSLLKNIYSGDELQVPYLVADVQLRLIDNKSVGAYVIQKLHARGRH